MSTRPSRARFAPRPVAARHPHPLQLPEILFWSFLGWIYWMALMVMLVWAVAQATVGFALYREPALETRLQEYALIGTRWRPLSDAGDAAEATLGLIEQAKALPLWGMISRVSIPGAVTKYLSLEVVEGALNLLSYAGKEFRALSELEHLAGATQEFRANPSRTNLQALMTLYVTGAATLTQTQTDLDKLVDGVDPIVGATGFTTSAIAGGLRANAAYASGFEAQVFTLADQLERLPAPAIEFIDDAKEQSKQIAKDAQLLRSMQHTIAVADLRESIVTYFIFRGFIKWFMTHVWTIDGVLAIVIALRVSFGHRRIFFTALSALHPSSTAVSPTIG